MELMESNFTFAINRNLEEPEGNIVIRNIQGILQYSYTYRVRGNSMEDVRQILINNLTRIIQFEENLNFALREFAPYCMTKNEVHISLKYTYEMFKHTVIDKYLHKRNRHALDVECV